MTRAEFRPIVATLCAGLDREMAPAQAEVWFQLLERFPAEACQAAVLRFLSEAADTFLPAPGTIIRMTTEALCGASEPAESAYRRLCAVRIGWGAQVHRGELIARKHLDDRLWSIIEGLGGWERFCGEREGSQSTEFAQFRSSWNSATAAAVLAVAIPQEAQPRIQQATPAIARGGK